MTVQPLAAVIPRVNGRHQDKALAAARKAHAIGLRLQGLTYQAIAAEMGYKSAGSVHKIVNDALAVQVAEQADLLRTVEVDRLNALQVPLWDKALEGDLAAATAVVKIIDARCRVLGLYEPRSKKKQDDWDNCQGPATVVLRADDCRHAGCCFPRARLSTKHRRCTKPPAEGGG